MMSYDDFIKKSEEEEDWAPGWEAIDTVFDGLYPGQSPEHFGTNMLERAVFGGDQYLDGYSVYTSPNGYKHIVTYGMTQLYVEKDSFGGEWNQWGYEMTMKLIAANTEDCMWAIDVLSNLARYTYTSERYFDPFQLVGNRGEPVKAGADTAITAFLTVSDTEARGIDTVYGRTGFIQLVGITQAEYEMLKSNISKAEEFVSKLRDQYPNLETDLCRSESILF